MPRSPTGTSRGSRRGSTRLRSTAARSRSTRVGQHAGTLKVGSNPGDNATLNITSGWLKVENPGVGAGTGEVIIGADNAATATLSLSGGELSAETLSKGAGGSFGFTGGKLHADVVNFDLVNDGGTLAPGNQHGHDADRW